MRLLVVLCLVLVAAAAPAAAALSPIRATMSTSSTEPLADEPWRYRIAVTSRQGEPLAARARLQLLRGRTVVGCWKRTAMVACSSASAGTWIPFTGTRTDVLAWPTQFAGRKLAFQAIVVTGNRSLRLRAPLTVQLP